jgi:HK97 family phage portal protein
MPAIVLSAGFLTDVTPSWWKVNRYGSLRFYNQYNYDYATIYRTQPNVRTCVDFLARNIAQLGLHVFRRVSDTDRKRLTDHPLADLIARPLPPPFKVTRYRLIEALLSDLGIYFNAYWLKVRAGSRLGLLRIPPPLVEVKGGLVPTRYDVTIGAQLFKFQPDEVVHFYGFNPENPLSGLSPMETLRRILAEEHAAGDYREHFWRNAARMGGFIERPQEAPEWSSDARGRFKEEFEALYSGGDNSGKTAILEEGMTWKPGTFSSQESEYLDGRKLTREECARAYHIPLPLVGILDHATFSNISEQHKHLYQDCLGPWLVMVEQDMELQLLPEFEDVDNVYLEFNIAEKLAGSFKEQAESLQAAVGRPWMAPNEARARLNLPAKGGDADELATPLNVIVGGQASPRDSAPKGEPPLLIPPNGRGKKAAGELDPTLPELRAKYQEKWVQLLVRTFERQRASVMSRVKAAPDIMVLWDSDRWNRELGADFYALGATTALEWGHFVAEAMEVELQEDEMLPWLLENSRIAAEYVNESTMNQVEEALQEDEPMEALANVFALAAGTRAGLIATGRVTALSNFGSQEGARQGNLRTKTWKTNSGNPRPSHARMNGETVGIRETFSNGLRWPGDPRGSAEETAGCQCSVVFGRQ